jgi:hypothetical protein
MARLESRLPVEEQKAEAEQSDGERHPKAVSSRPSEQDEPDERHDQVSDAVIKAATPTWLVCFKPIIHPVIAPAILRH